MRASTYLAYYALALQKVETITLKMALGYAGEPGSPEFYMATDELAKASRQKREFFKKALSRTDEIEKELSEIKKGRTKNEGFR